MQHIDVLLNLLECHIGHYVWHYMSDFIERRKDVMKRVIGKIERDKCHWVIAAPDGALITFLY